MSKRIKNAEVLRQLGVVFNLGAVREATDGQLLERFATGRGEAAELAFAALVERHGPMVLRACRAVLRDDHEARDAFQATFLALARKARRLWVRDSLAPWLHQAACRAALGARSDRFRRRFHERRAAMPVARFAPEPLDDLGAVLHAEIDRLPSRYRSVVVLCDLEGRTQEQAARHLGCPVGTVKSRLSRGRARLRDRLTRRGLAPSIGAPLGAVPPALAEATGRAALRLLAGERLTGAVPAAVVGLSGMTLRSMAMSKLRATVGVSALILSTTGGAFALVRGGDDEAETTPLPPAAAAEPPAEEEVDAGAEPSEPPLAEQLDRIRDEYETASRAFHTFYRGSTILEEDLEEALKVQPDYPAVVRRIFALAATAPDYPAVRDAMLWMVEKAYGGRDAGPLAGEFALAANWLVRHFGDDPDAVRVGLQLDNVSSANRDTLLLNFYASAKGRESKGLARLALAQYFQHKAMRAEWARGVEGRPTITHDDIVAADGSFYTVKEVMNDWDYAYLQHLKQCDPAYLRAEAERLYEEVIAEYGDVPYITARDRMMEGLLTHPEPQWNGEPLTEDDCRRIEETIARRRSTLGQIAEARLDDWFNLAVGKEAPEIEGESIDGRPLTLSDYRGRVVAVAFWGSWCAPCVREIPRERALVERMAGRPFAMLGVNTDDDPDAARRAIEAHGVSWPNWHDGPPGSGPIARRYHVRGYPTVYVLDAQGVIRSKDTHGESLDRLVEELVAEAEAEATEP